MIVCGIVLAPLRANAQWWSRAPADYEDCAESAEKTATSKDARANLVSDCEAKFAGRRKTGGGYTYYDFMQNRHFDIAGPNPTPAEQKQIDEQYTIYLNDQKRSIIAAAFLEKQREQTQQARAVSGNVKLTASPKLDDRSNVAVIPKPRPKTASCKSGFFSSCSWPRLSSGLQDIKKTLFGSSSHKAARS